MRLQNARPLLATVALAAAGLATTACGQSMTDGVQSVYSVSHVCPAASVVVTARPDLAPHTVLKGVTPPPGVDLDAVGDTYEVSGCSQKQVIVCGHPVVGNHADPFSAAVSSGDDGTHLTLNTETFELIRAFDVSGNRVTSVVVCQPGTTTVQ